jgi:hypothetical protein
MLSTNHVVAGGALGLVLRRHPVLAVLAGFASHLALDAMPHWGADSSDDFFRVARRDGVAGAALMVVTFVLAPPKARAALAGAMLASVAPDSDMVLDYFINRTVHPKWFTKIHVRVQRGRESPHRMIQEVVTATIGAALLTLAVRALARRDFATAL